MIAKRLPFLVLVSIVCFLGVSRCDKDNQITTEKLSRPSGLDTAFYVTTDFILRLNVLIKHLAMVSLNDTLDSRETILHAGEMWNHTQTSLEDLVHRSRSAVDVLPRGNLTNTSLHAALDAVRSERSNFMTRAAFFNPSMATEIDAMMFIDRTYQAGGIVARTNPGIMLLMHSSVHRLSKISEGLLGTLAAIGSNDRNGQARANPTQSTVELFNAGFQRSIVDTQLNFQTQSNRLLRRVRAQLATITQTSELGLYLTNYTALITTFKTNVTTHLNRTNTNVMAAMNVNRTTIDLQLSTGITNLLALVTASTSQAFLELCLNRYVFPYYAQSLAVAKLLFCGEPELSTLEYLVTVAVPILERAAISDSSAVKMSGICSTGSTACMTNYYNSLAAQFMGAQTRLQSYVEFINQELLGLEQRVYVCTNSTVLDVANYVTVIATKFTTCLSTGAV